MTTVRRFVLILILALITGLSLRAADIAELIKKLPAQNAEERDKLCTELFKEGAPGIKALCKMLVEPGKGDDVKVRFALHGMAIHASRPGGDADRKLFGETVAAELSGDAPSLVKAFLLTQLRLTAGDEQVAQIAKFLDDKELSDHAAQTLLTLRTPSVAPALRAALATAKEGPRVTVITALGALRDKDAAAEILKDAESPDSAIKNAALHALANIGDASAAPALTKAAGVADLYDRSQALQASLTLAQRLVDLGKKAEAAKMCRSLSLLQIGPKEAHIQCAALNILATAETEGAFDDLKAALKNESIEVRVTALNIASSIPGEAVTKRWAAELKTADPKFAVETLAVLERRNDPSACPAITESAKHADATVRAAALHAAAICGKDALPVLLAALGQDASKDNADELAAARSALARMKSKEINAALAGALTGASLNLRKALIGALSDRGAVEHLAILVAATSDADAGIRATAFDSVGFLGDMPELTALVKTIVKTQSDDDRASAEKAALAIGARTEHKGAAAALIQDAMIGAPVKAQQSMLRVLAKIGGTDALAAIKPALKDPAAEVADTAVRELANWPDNSALPELLDIAKNSKELTHHVLALNGYIRLLDVGAKKPVNERLASYKGALELCRRPEEKKKVISSIQTVKTVESAKMVEALMSDDALREEACNAAFNIAKELAKNEKNAAREAFEKVIATTKREDLKKNVQTELDKLPKK